MASADKTYQELTDQRNMLARLQNRAVEKLEPLRERIEALRVQETHLVACLKAIESRRERIDEGLGRLKQARNFRSSARNLAATIDEELPELHRLLEQAGADHEG